MSRKYTTQTPQIIFPKRYYQLCNPNRLPEVQFEWNYNRSPRVLAVWMMKSLREWWGAIIWFKPIDVLFLIAFSATSHHLLILVPEWLSQDLSCFSNKNQSCGRIADVPITKFSFSTFQQLIREVWNSTLPKQIQTSATISFPIWVPSLFQNMDSPNTSKKLKMLVFLLRHARNDWFLPITFILLCCLSKISWHLRD